MIDQTMYHGTIYVMDTETGNEANVAVQIVISDTSMAYTIRSLCADMPAITVTADDPVQIGIVRHLLAVMQRVSVPA